MFNSYHYKLSIPVSININETWNTERLSWYDSIHSELITFLESLGISIRHAQRFYTPPYGSLPIHVDSHEAVGQAKLNYIVGGKDSAMNWFKLKPGKTMKTMVTDVGSNYLYAEEEDVVKVHSAEIGYLSIINSGELHSITNGPEPRVCYSFVLKYPDKNKNLSWHDAVKLLKPYLIE